MSGDILYYVIMFKSVNHTLWAGNVLKKAEIPHKIIPVPRKISSDCGVCIRLDSALKDSGIESLRGIVEYSDIREL